MHLQGKELVSLATQRSARSLTATAIVIVLAKYFAVLPAELELVGVTISETAVAGAMFWIVLLQAINHLVHWFGDCRSMWTWNSAEKVNGLSRWSAGSNVLSKLDSALENIEEFINERRTDPKSEKSYPDLIAAKLDTVVRQLAELKPSIESYRSYGAFYFFGWFLAFPLLVAIIAVCLPPFPAAEVATPLVPF